MHAALQSAVNQILARVDLTVAEMESAVGAIMDGAASEVAIASLLTALRMKDECVDEIVGAARAMRSRVTRIRPKRTGLLDTCGTGGDSLHTFNISTATALVAAAAGVPVAKHGNRSVSSSSGSADVLEQLGVCISLEPDRVALSIDEIGIGFCFAPLLHGAMKFAAPVRRELGFRTIFNLLGPLTNPAGAEYQLLGSHHPRTAELLARALAELGTGHACVVCGAGQLDEVSLWGTTDVFEIRDGSVQHHRWTAASFGLPECSVSDLQVDGPEASARLIREVLQGQPGAATNMVIANAAAALWTADAEPSLLAAVDRVRDTIQSGQAAELLHQLAGWTSGS